MRTKAVAGLPILILLLAMPVFLFAEPVTIKITAKVSSVDDRNNLLGEAIKVDDIIEGTYTYESTTPDSNPSDETVGDYRYHDSVFGITLESNGLIFKTDPDSVDFLVEISNDHYSGFDNYLLRSYNNLPLPGGVYVHHIAWQLDDATHTAISSDALPVEPPVLTNWQSVCGLTITGGSCAEHDPLCRPMSMSSDFFIRAHVITATIEDAHQAVSRATGNTDEISAAYDSGNSPGSNTVESDQFSAASQTDQINIPCTTTLRGINNASFYPWSDFYLWGNGLIRAFMPSSGIAGKDNKDDLSYRLGPVFKTALAIFLYAGLFLLVAVLSIYYGLR